MQQQLISSFFHKQHSGEKTFDRRQTYNQIVQKLTEEAEKAFENQKKKADASKTTSSQNIEAPILPPKMSYKKYSLQQKTSIINLVPYMSLIDIQEKYGVDESTIRYWVNNGVKPDGRKENGKVAKLKEVEDLLIQDLLLKREEGSAITSTVIFKKMKELMMNHYNINSQEFSLLQNFARYCSKNGVKHDTILFLLSNQDFKSFDKEDQEIKLKPEEAQSLRDAFIKIKKNLIIIDKGWLQRFTKTNNLSYRKITHTSIKTKAELENDVLEFLSKIHKFRKEEEISPEFIINFDETSIFYDTIPNYTYDLKGAQHPFLKTSKVQKKRLTAGLSITASGDKLTPLLIFKGKGIRVNKLINSRNFMIKKNTNAWMTTKIFKDYLNGVIKPYILEKRRHSEFKDQKALIIIDNFSAHKLEESQYLEFEKLGIFIRYLKPYTTHLCQPLDLNINFILKSKMRTEWMEWMEKQEGTNPSKTTIYNWFYKSWKAITPLNIVKAFLMSGISNDLNGSEDILSESLTRLRAFNHERETMFSKEAASKEFFEDVNGNPEQLFFNVCPEEEAHVYEFTSPNEEEDR